MHHRLGRYKVVLSWLGYFPEEELMTLNANGTNLPGHCDRLRTIGIDMTTGSLGLRLRRVPCSVWALIGCGESDEGQVWEAAMAAGKYREARISWRSPTTTASKSTGRTRRRCRSNRCPEKWRAFGWECMEADGHDWDDIYSRSRAAEAVAAKPTMVICHTIKGKAVSYAENQVTSHNIKMNPELTRRALEDLSPASCYAQGAAQ